MITRRAFVAGLAAASAGSLLPRFPAFAHVRNFTPIRRGVGTFSSRGGTIGYLATEDALVVVDCQFPDTASTCWTGLQDKTARGLDLLVNTHHHGDHTAGNPVFSDHAAVFAAHANVPVLQRASAESSDRLDQQAFATTTYTDKWHHSVGDEVVHLSYHGPAHTSGDSVVYFEKADIVHMGDLMFNRMPPFIDRGAGASIANWIVLLEIVHGTYTDDTVFIYGHGGPNHGVVGTREDLLVFRDFLAGLLEYVQSGIAAGESADIIAAVDRLPDFPDHYLESWEGAIPNAIRIAHQELTED